MHRRSSSTLKQTNKQDKNKVTIPSLQPKQLSKKLRVLTWQGDGIGIHILEYIIGDSQVQRWESQL